ncbi:MAG TPA: site-specific integrase [Propionibacteriaceae bacterium]|nr:site-specific integrase [Propionibacteriaceae bacterium]
MASIERRVIQRRDNSGRLRKVTRYRVRYRDQDGKWHSETKERLVDAERRKAEVELQLADGAWRDPRRGLIKLSTWIEEWIPSRHDLRPTTRARLKATIKSQILPRFGNTALSRISNSAVRAWVQEMLDDGLAPTSVRKAVFALRQALEAAIADGRLFTNAALNVPLPAERAKPPRFLTQAEVERLCAAMPERYRALVLVGAYAGLRWGEAAGLTRMNVEIERSRIRVTSTAIEIGGHVSLGQQPKTTRSKRTIPVARAVIERVQAHLDQFVPADPDALVFTSPMGGPLARSRFTRRVWRPATEAAGLRGLTFHGLRHSFVAILVAAGCNVREVSEWAGHTSVAFTLTRYGGLYDDGSDAAVDRLDALLNPSTDPVTEEYPRHVDDGSCARVVPSTTSAED